MRIAIVEDEALFSRQLEQHLARFSQESGVDLNVQVFQNGRLLLDDAEKRWDLILLDVDMPMLDGISAARAIRQIDQNVQIIFVTNLAQYAIHGYEVNALDYVLKPVNYYTLKLKLNKAMRHMDTKDDHVFLLKRKKDVVKVWVSQLYYVESYDHLLRFHTASGVIENTGSYTMAKVEEKLKGDGFVRCHNSILVNLRHVHNIKEGVLQVYNQELPISRQKHQAVLDAMLAYAKGEQNG